MDLLFGYIAGLLTLINPCVLPVLPIALAASVSEHRLGPVALAAGMSLTFTFFGIFITVLGPTIGVSLELVSNIGATIMILFGIILIVPKFSEKFAVVTAGLSSKADININKLNTDDKSHTSSLKQQFIGGGLLGAVWVPCIGPTIGGAISLASQGQSLVFATSIMLAFSLGISTVILALAYGTREAIITRRDKMKFIAEKSKPIMGIAFIIVGLLILTKFYQTLEILLLDAMPIWLQDLSVRY
ncbi:MAG: cytochrome c biogenesis protein CcdA [Rhizobiales bacterium]|nr:cytochrome c biogenesis protein CcdA [Hyphomicrobiales bacterium]